MATQRLYVSSSQSKSGMALVAAIAIATVALLLLLGEVAYTVEGKSESERPPVIDFARDIQPILAGKCVRCHGPETHEAGLRLDDAAVARSVLESGNRAVVPNEPKLSEILRRVTADATERMPPDEPALETDSVRKLERWIAEGAAWPAHWAYQPLAKTTPPSFDDRESEDWCRTPIDRFILAELREKGLRPSPEADRRTLVRRLYFDVLGLPPLPAEVDAFLNDESADAYEKMVERLLANPQYGERWARHWMDIVHYADSHGFEHDMPRSMWPYRDYLIQAFNSDKPYAQFIREQIAGDVIAPDDPHALTATGFLATGPWDQSTLQSGQVDTDDYRISQYLDRDDIVSTIMSTFVSSTVHCARCHDHKFDPISQNDYYSLQAVVSGIDKASREYDPDPQIGKKRRELTSQLGEVGRRRASQDVALLEPALQERVSRWEEEYLAQDSRWIVLDPIELRSANGADLIEQDGSIVLSSGPCPDKDVYTVVAEVSLPAITMLRLEVLADPGLPQGGPGRQGNGNLHLTELIVTAAPADNPTASQAVTLVRPRADFNQMPGWTINDSIDQLPQTGWGIFPEVGRTHTAVFELDQPIRSEQRTRLTIKLHQELGRQHLIGRFRLAVRGDIPPRSLEQATFPAEISAILSVKAEARTDQHRMALAAFYEERRIEQELAQLPAQQTVYCGTNQFKASSGLIPSAVPRPVYVLTRGEIKTPGALAQPGALRCVAGLPGELHIADASNEGQRRSALADWLADSRNSLTWRSIANRIWQFHFGQAIVDTPNDFGHMGSAPTHPELLDWMANTLLEDGGSLKSLHRTILLSSSYRQSSQAPELAAEIDADNRYFSHMSIGRLDAESLRDSMLKLSGQLDTRIGGPPVKHFIEIKGLGLRPEADYQNFSVDDPANNRRSIYRFVFRTMPDPLMNALDCPDGTQLSPTRNVSITALQALAMVNDKFIIRQSEHIAERLRKEHPGTDMPRLIDSLFQLVLCRPPKAEEAAAVTKYANQFGLANACRFLMNLNEFVFVE